MSKEKSKPESLVVQSSATPPTALAAMERRFSFLLNAVLDYAIFLMDPRGNIQSWNRGAERVNGYGEQDVLGRHFSIFFSSEEVAAQKPQTMLEKTFGEKRLEIEGWFPRKDGARFWANIVLTPVFDDAGVHLGYACVIRDMTERRTMIEELRQSEERFRLLTQAVKDYAIFMLDPNGYIASWNEGAQRAKGYSSDEIIGKHFSVFYTPEDRAKGRPAEILESAKRFGRVEDEGWRMRKNGDRFWADVVITPLYDPQKRLIGFAKVTRDLTERKVASETIETTQRQIVELQKMEAIGRLAGGIAHDFNNLVSGIIGCTDAIADLTSSSEILAEATEIRKACERASSLTRQLMAFSRRQMAAPRVLDLNHLVGDLQGMMNRLISADIKIATRFSSDLRPIKADAAQIQQVILNLMLNARDAMPQGGRLEVRTENIFLDAASGGNDFEIQPGQYVMLAVSDSGIGMSVEVQRRMFEPFFTTKEVGKGTGLGLSTVYGIVRQNDGGILVSSAPGVGTTIKVFLPSHPEMPGASNNEGKSAAGSLMPRGTETILVVEDDALVLRNAVRVLQNLGYTVLSASDGQEAIVTFKKAQEKVQLLLTDVIMPGMNGRQLADKLREMAKDLPVLYMSGYAADIISERGLVDPAIDFLEKPFNSQTLSQRVREALDR